MTAYPVLVLAVVVVPVLLVAVVVDVVLEVGAGVAILVNVLQHKGYNPTPCTFRVSCAA